MRVEDLKLELTNGQHVFSGVDLSKTILRGINLTYTSFDGAKFINSHFDRIDLTRSDLHGSDLRGCIIGCSLLCYADLSGCDLRSAVIRSSILNKANLKGTDLRDACYSIPSMLMANWDSDDELTTILMRLDASAMEDGEFLMTAWAESSPYATCPELNGYQRIAMFKERRECWSPGPIPSLFEIWEMIAKQNDVRIAGRQSMRRMMSTPIPPTAPSAAT